MKKIQPLGLLFKEIGKNYYYDTITNRIVAIDDKTFLDIDKCLKGEGKMTKNIEYMISKGMISTTTISNIYHPMTDYLECLLNNYVSSITLQVTQNCNMRCRYCSYSGDGLLDRTRNGTVMTWEIAKESIDFLFTHSKYAKNITIAFYGGEPLLNYDLIRRIVDYSNKLFVGRHIDYGMTTNGTVMNDEILRLIEENNFNLLLSLDGSKDCHDKNRRMLFDGSGSYRLIERNLLFIKDKAPSFYKKIIFNSVVELDHTIDNCVDFFSDCPMTKDNRVVINEVYDKRINVTYPVTEEYTNSKDVFLLNNLLNEYAWKNEPNVEVGEIKEIKKTIKVLSSQVYTKSVSHPAGVCIPGLNKAIVDCTGKIRICERVSEKNESFIIGDVINGFYISKIKKLLNIGNLTAEKCEQCWAFNLCDQCVARISDNGELNSINKSKECHSTQKKAFRNLKAYIAIKEAYKL